jgi:hypothetical protein
VLVTLILTGWRLAQFSHLVTPNVTIENAAAPESTLRLLLLALGAGVGPCCRRLFTSSKSSKDKNSGSRRLSSSPTSSLETHQDNES